MCRQGLVFKTGETINVGTYLRFFHYQATDFVIYPPVYLCMFFSVCLYVCQSVCMCVPTCVLMHLSNRDLLRSLHLHTSDHVEKFSKLFTFRQLSYIYVISCQKKNFHTPPQPKARGLINAWIIVEISEGWQKTIFLEYYDVKSLILVCEHCSTAGDQVKSVYLYPFDWLGVSGLPSPPSLSLSLSHTHTHTHTHSYASILTHSLSN